MVSLWWGPVLDSLSFPQTGRDSLVLGVYQSEREGGFELTPMAKHFDDSVNGSLQEMVEK